MVQYTYDGWGNCRTTVIDEESTQTAELNPFRYRSYYYDRETHLYNLKTRYYDPETGRFVSQDDVSYLDPEHINGLNLFAYCGNNPVMRVDEYGLSWSVFWSSVGNWFKDNWYIIVGAAVAVACVTLSIVTFGLGAVLTGVIAGSVIGASFGAVNAFLCGNNVLYGMLTGMIVGALGGISGGAIGAVLAGVASAAGAFTMSVIGDDVNGRKRKIDKAVVSAITAGLFSFLGSGFSNFVSGESLAVMAIWNTMCAFIFNSYSFIADIIYDVITRKDKNVQSKQIVYL